jgi:hypothetical protein
MSKEHAAETFNLKTPQSPVRPKMFISYSWTSPGHQERVRQWAERLLQDGIDVVLDSYDLKEGHDKYSFMERMVRDPNITHVLVVCDKAYSEKADAKKAGVGTESQIISREVYEKVEQSKFIPVVCEFSEDHEPYLPIFFKSRIWIDFSSPEAVNENWERLVRVLYGKPAHQKPSLGNPPAYITTDTTSPSSPAIGKFSTFKYALLQNSKGLSSYRRDFLSACIEYANALRVRERPDIDSLGTRVLEDCGMLKNVRNQIIDWVLLESDIATSDDFLDSLLELLESLRELKSRPAELNTWNDAWFEAHSVFVYETFLYIIAALLKTKSYNIMHEIFSSHYLRPKSEMYSNNKFDDFGSFYGCSETLQSVLAPAGKRLFSPAAELIKRQADRQDIPFSSVMEAELLVLLMAFISEEVHWYPQTLHYMSLSEFPFFIRATQHKHFLKLAIITGIPNADALRDTVKAGYQRLQVDRWHDFVMLYNSFWNCMNMDKLDSIK